MRQIINRQLFEKGTSPKWSKAVHTIVDKTEHTYTLDNKKVYKYYELQPVTTVETLHVVKTRNKAREPTLKDLKTERTIKRRLNKEGLSMSDIIIGPRTRTMTLRGLEA